MQPYVRQHIAAFDAFISAIELPRIPACFPKMLTQQLRELEADRLIVRTVYPAVPPKTEYSLSEFGKTLSPLLDQLCAWGEEYLWDEQNHCAKII